MHQIQKIINESEIQRAVVQHARSKGWIVFRFADRSAPDRIFFGHGTAFMIEFKRRGKKPRPDQVFTINELRGAGARVFVIDNIEQGKFVVNEQSRN